MDPLQARPLQHLALQGIHECSTGAVLGMQDPPVAVGGLQGGAQSAFMAVKVHAQLQEPLDAGRRLAHE